MEIPEFCRSSHFFVSPGKKYIYREEYPITPFSTVFYIQKGSVVLMKNLTKKDKFIKKREAGDFFGISEIFIGLEERLFTAITSEKSEIYYWSDREFITLLQSNREFANFITMNLSNMLRTITEKLNLAGYEYKQLIKK